MDDLNAELLLVVEYIQLWYCYFNLKKKKSILLIPSFKKDLCSLYMSHVMNSTGGLGEAVSSAMVNESGFSLHRLAVSHVPRSGKPHELLKIYGIDRDAIAQAIRKMLSSSTNAK